jgi:hypothetical protein
VERMKLLLIGSGRRYKLLDQCRTFSHNDRSIDTIVNNRAVNEYRADVRIIGIEPKNTWTKQEDKAQQLATELRSSETSVNFDYSSSHTKHSHCCEDI